MLYVRGGIYAERIGGKDQPFLSVPDGTPTAPITVKAYPGEPTSPPRTAVLNDPDNWVFDGLNVTRSGLNSPEEHMVRIRNGTNWTYHNAEISGARSYANFNVLSSVRVRA